MTDLQLHAFNATPPGANPINNATTNLTSFQGAFGSSFGSTSSCSSKSLVNIFRLCLLPDWGDQILLRHSWQMVAWCESARVSKVKHSFVEPGPTYSCSVFDSIFCYPCTRTCTPYFCRHKYKNTSFTRYA